MSKQTPRCRHCEEVIGMYEPVVTLVEGTPLRTSRLAAPAGQLASWPCFHSDCFEESESGPSEEP
jgi:hypothetical protein